MLGTIGNISKFYTITNLQGSQTHDTTAYDRKSFTPLQTYKVLKQSSLFHKMDFCFTPLQTYKVLKPITISLAFLVVLHHYKLTRFSNVAYKVGKIIRVLHHYKLTRFSNYLHEYSHRDSVLHHYKLTRFSNYRIALCVKLFVLHHYKLTRFSNQGYGGVAPMSVLHHYKLTRFSNSVVGEHYITVFYTITNLQGSQTQLVRWSGRTCFTPLQTYKVLKHRK